MMNYSRSLCLAAACLAIAGCSSPSTRPPAKSALDLSIERNDKLRPQLDAGGAAWANDVERSFARRAVETTAEHQQRVGNLLNSTQTTATYARNGERHLYFSYDADLQVLKVDVALYPESIAVIGDALPAEAPKTNPCFARFGRGLAFGGRRDSVEAGLLFVNVPLQCGKSSYSIVKQDVPVSIAEMRQVIDRLVWLVDVLPSPNAAGKLSGYRHLNMGARLGTLNYSSVTVKLQELRLQDPDTGKVYFRATAK